MAGGWLLIINPAVIALTGASKRFPKLTVWKLRWLLPVRGRGDPSGEGDNDFNYEFHTLLIQTFAHE